MILMVTFIFNPSIEEANMDRITNKLIDSLINSLIMPQGQTATRENDLRMCLIELKYLREMGKNPVTPGEEIAEWYNR